MVLMMVLADVRVLRASLSHITSSSIYLVIIVNKYGGLLVKTKTVMLLLFELPFFNVPYIPAFILTILISFCYSICGNLSGVLVLCF